MRNFPAQVGPGGEPVSDSGSFTSSNANDAIQEEQNAITSSGQTLIPLANPADNTQLSQALARYASAGIFGVDSGAANAYVISSIGSFTVPDAYFDGMKIAFFAVNANTIASTVNAFGIGVVDLVQQDGTALFSGFIDVIILTEAQFDSGSGKFFVTGAAGTTAGGVQTVSGTNVDNTDPQNPIIENKVLWTFTPALQAVTFSNTLNVPHLLGATPEDWRFDLVANTANNGFAIGDETLFSTTQNGVTESGIQYGVNLTNMFVTIGTGIVGMRKDTNVIFNLVAAQWDWKLRAKL